MAGQAPHIPGCRDLSLIGERVARSLFSATSERLGGRPVTVTLYPPLAEGRTREGFDAAAGTAQRLGVHPSVVTIHEWGFTDDGRPWVVTDPQPAQAVDSLVTQEGPLDCERALQVGVLLAGALETAHAAGIVHGDLSPARLVFGSHGEPLLAETGLAVFAVFPGLGALNNPVHYHAPPEVLEQTALTAATDVYALAATVYTLVGGRAPHQKPAEVTDSNASLLLRILQLPVPRLERPDVPVGLDEALAGPLSPDPPKRPQRAIEVAWRLQDVQRRAGWAVTEPVVMDLDGIAHHRSPRAGDLTPPPLPTVSAPAPPPPAWPETPVEAPATAAAADLAAAAAGAWPPDVPTPAPVFPVPEPDNLAPWPTEPDALDVPTMEPDPVASAADLAAAAAGAWPPAPADPSAAWPPPAPDAEPPTIWPDALATAAPGEAPPPPPPAPAEPALHWAEPPESPAEPPAPDWGGTAEPGTPTWPSTLEPPPDAAMPAWATPAPPEPPAEPAAPPWATPPEPPAEPAAPPWAALAEPPAQPAAPGWPANAPTEPPAEPPTPPWASPTEAPAEPAPPGWAATAPTEPPAEPPAPRWASPTEAPAQPPWAATPEAPAEPAPPGWDATAPTEPPAPPWASPTEAPAEPPWAATAPPEPPAPPWASPTEAPAQPAQPPWAATPEAPAGPAAPGWAAASPAQPAGPATPPWAATPEPPAPPATPPWAATPEAPAEPATPGWAAAAPAESPSEPGTPPSAGAPTPPADAPAPRPEGFRAGWAAAAAAEASEPIKPGWAAAAEANGNGHVAEEPPSWAPTWPALPPPSAAAASSPVMPPELDQLPAWYTDPLPSEKRGNGRGRVLGVPAGPITGELPRPDWLAATSADAPLPGAGDELRSLFGAVVGDQEPAPDPAAGHDPLGPPMERPPIDLNRLGRDFDGPGGVPPTLPRRLDGPPLRRTDARAGEVWPPQAAPAPPALPKGSRPTAPPIEPWNRQGGYSGDDAAMPALPARRAAERGGAPAAAAPTAAEQAAAPASAPPPPVEAPKRQSSRAREAAANAGPPALPVIVLVAVVAILLLGVAWLVINGDDAGQPASEGGGNPVTARVPTAVTAQAGPEGVRVSWKGDAQASYVVTVMSSAAPPRTLPPTKGTAVLVPPAGAPGGAGQCYTVAVAPAEQGGKPGPASEPGCIPGASVDQMRPPA